MVASTLPNSLRQSGRTTKAIVMIGSCRVCGGGRGMARAIVIICVSGTFGWEQVISENICSVELAGVIGAIHGTGLSLVSCPAQY